MTTWFKRWIAGSMPEAILSEYDRELRLMDITVLDGYKPTDRCNVCKRYLTPKVFENPRQPDTYFCKGVCTSWRCEVSANWHAESITLSAESFIGISLLIGAATFVAIALSPYWMGLWLFLAFMAAFFIPAIWVK